MFTVTSYLRRLGRANRIDHGALHGYVFGRPPNNNAGLRRLAGRWIKGGAEPSEEG